MSNTLSKKPLAVVLGAAFALSGMAAAQASVFQATDLSSGYTVALAGDGKAGEHKCGEGKTGDGKTGEGKCGEKKKEAGEGKCGEGKCGEKKKEGG